jgi:hypothetical protein
LSSSGLLGAGLLQREITGASSLPHRLIFLDRVVLIEYQKIYETRLGIAMIIDGYNPAFLPSLKHGLHTFIKTYQNELKDWNGKTTVFDNFRQKLIDIFSYALTQDILDEKKESVNNF